MKILFFDTETNEVTEHDFIIKPDGFIIPNAFIRRIRILGLSKE